MSDRLSDSQVVRDVRTGKPLKVRIDFELPVGDTAIDAVKAFLLINADELGLDREAKDLKKEQDVDTPTGRVVRYKQIMDEIPIVNTEIQVRLDSSSHVRQIDLALAPSLRIIQPIRDEKALISEAAIKSARDSLGSHIVRKEIATPEKVYFPTPEGLRLAYEVLILTREPPHPHDWRVIVDAYSGDILTKYDLIWDVDGQGLVFDPNPVVTAGNNTFRDPTATVAACSFAGTPLATIDAQRFSRTLNGITLSGGKYKLEGPYVKLRDLGTPYVAPPEEPSASGFNYSCISDGFEAVTVYYHVDTLQRHIQNALGIHNANNRQIEADAHDVSYYNGAWYSPGDKGLHFGDSGPCMPDRAEDADCIYHEYNHAIMDNVKPGYGPSGVANPVTGRRESRAIGEGFGDILPCIYFAPDHPFQREVFEDWVFAPAGLRRVDGTKIYPADWVDEEHDDGEIWSATLWNIYRTIGGDSLSVATQRAARDELLKTMISSYFALTTNPNMMDAAETMLDMNAGLPEYRLQHGIEMLNSFHDRGILQCAAGSDLKVTELWSQQNELPEGGWQQVEYGQDNWFYARVRNNGATAARAAIITFSFQCPYVTPVYPADWRNKIFSAAIIYDVAPGDTKTVKARFPKEMIPPLPPGTTILHGCILAEIYNPEDHAPAGCTSLGCGNGKLFQRNSDVVNAIPGDTLDYQLVISNYHVQHEQLVQLEVIRPVQWESTEIFFGHSNPRVIESLWQKAVELETLVTQPVVEGLGIATEIHILEPTRIITGAIGDEPGIVLSLARGSTLSVPTVETSKSLRRTTVGIGLFKRGVELVKEAGKSSLKLNPGHAVGFSYVMQPRERLTLDVKFKVPADARPGDRLKYEVVQRNDKGEVIGGFDVLVNVVAK